MKVRQIGLQLGLMLFVSGALLAQEARPDPQDASQFEATPAPLPNGNNVWSVRMVRSGGFAGRTLTATATSDGTLTCFSCADGTKSRSLSSEDLRAIVPTGDLKAALAGNSTVKAVKPGEKLALLPSGLCRDCFVTRMIVQHRDSQGKVETYLASWDDVTAAGAPAELVRLAGALSSLAK
jgi:hypothetical protein